MNDDVTLRNQVITMVSIGEVSAIQTLLWSDSSFNSLTRLPGRVGNLHRDRESSLLEVRSWDDDMFRRQFRLNRCDFNDLLQIIAPYLTTCATYARNSSGSAICPELRLLIALRVLAGASYLDMIWYNVSINHVMSLVVNVCKCINEHVDNISFPSYGDEDGYRALQDGWKRRIYRKFGGMGVGILDGIAFCITEPRASDLDGKSSSSYMNRKGFFALITQAFCDSYCRFLYCTGQGALEIVLLSRSVCCMLLSKMVWLRRGHSLHAMKLILVSEVIQLKKVKGENLQLYLMM